MEYIITIFMYNREFFLLLCDQLNHGLNKKSWTYIKPYNPLEKRTGFFFPVFIEIPLHDCEFILLVSSF